MTRKAMLDLGAETADITRAFLLRNALVLIVLVLTVLVAFTR